MTDSKHQGTPTESDSELLRRLLQEPDRGWRPFWTVHGPFVERVVGRFRLGDHHQDVLQEIAQSLIQNDCKKLRDWDPERSSLKRYLTVIAVSCTLNYVKSSKYRFQLLKVDSIDPATGSGESIGAIIDEAALSPLERLERIQIAELLKEALREWVEEEKIRPVDRRIVEYRLRGLTFKEIAEVLNLNLTHVTTRFSRIKPKLKKKLENSGILR